MKIKIFNLQRQKMANELYEEFTDHGSHPSNDEINSFYKEASSIIIDMRIGDIFEVDGIRYFYAPSGIEVHDPVVA